MTTLTTEYLELRPLPEDDIPRLWKVYQGTPLYFDGLGEDGPTHQPVEQTATLRLIPNMDVWRPGDAVETQAAWNAAIEGGEHPTCLVLSRQNLPHQARDAAQAHHCPRCRKRRFYRVAILVLADQRDAPILAADHVRLAQAYPLKCLANLADLGLRDRFDRRCARTLRLRPALHAMERRYEQQRCQQRAPNRHRAAHLISASSLAWSQPPAPVLVTTFTHSTARLLILNSVRSSTRTGC